MRPDRVVRRLIASLILLLWLSSSLVLAAATGTSEPAADMMQLPIMQFLASGLVALTGALARTAQKAVDRNRDPDFSLRRELMRDVSVSVLLGLLIYGYGASQAPPWDQMRLAVALGLAGYGGVALIDMTLARIKGGTGGPPA